MHVVTASIELPDGSERHAIPRLQILECEYSSQLSSLSCLCDPTTNIGWLILRFQQKTPACALAVNQLCNRGARNLRSYTWEIERARTAGISTLPSRLTTRPTAASLMTGSYVGGGPSFCVKRH